MSDYVTMQLVCPNCAGQSFGKMDMLFKPIRKCRTIHECFYCKQDIIAGQEYFDGGQKKRCHVNCKKKKST